ncbi:hypothetical protein VTN96DRAFT_7445 [Rasamsonia emersonii]
MLRPGAQSIPCLRGSPGRALLLRRDPCSAGLIIGIHLLSKNPCGKPFPTPRKDLARERFWVHIPTSDNDAKL